MSAHKWGGGGTAVVLTSGDSPQDVFFFLNDCKAWQGQYEKMTFLLQVRGAATLVSWTKLKNRAVPVSPLQQHVDGV